MTTATSSYPTTLLTSPSAPLSIPNWARPYAPSIAKPSGVARLQRLPELTIVRAKALGALLAFDSFLDHLSDRFEKTPEPSKIVFCFESKGPLETSAQLVELFERFSRPFDLEIGQGARGGAAAALEASAKIAAVRNRMAHRPSRVDVLGELKEVIAATADLRAESGRLSAKLVADAFGLSVAELSQLLERSRQAVSKTPDAESLQPLLRPYERAARLRAALSPEEFSKWLNMANDQLEESAPVDLIRQGRVSIVADLAEDMLTGSPT